MTILYICIGIVIGAAIAYLVVRGRSERSIADMQKQIAVGEARLQAARTKAADDITAERRHQQELRSQMQQQMDAKNKLMKEEIANMASRLFQESREKMNGADRERLDQMLSPLREKMEEFQKSVNDNSKENAANKTEIKTVFEEAMKKLHDEQERTVRELREQTERIGDGAEKLTHALKGDSKLQGDWGEMILKKTLENCGLIENQQFFTQANFKDDEGNNFRPDAIVEFPNNERAIIDAKVSLTAYQQAVSTDDAQEQQRLLKEHVASVKKHIDELSAKNYETIVPGSIGWVMMFIPYESGYAAALRTDPELLRYAWKKQIIILSPSNLLMSLQLISVMWRNYRVNENVGKILQQTNDLYDKFCNFASTFVKIGRDIGNLQRDYGEAHGQLSEGKGNVVRRLENLKELGISPKKAISDTGL